MLSKNKIKFAQSLHRKKYRQKYNKIIVEGSKLCAEVLSGQLAEIDSVYVTSDHADDPVAQGVAPSKLTRITNREMRKISMLKTPSPILLICTPPEHTRSDPPRQVTHTLYLDGIRDPGNMGTIIRTADWFGIHTIFLSGDCVEVFSPKVIQASMGSVFRVHCAPLERKAFESRFSGYRVFGADLKGKPVFDLEFPEKSVVILGNEGQGISPLLGAAIGQRISIPGAQRLGAESLNVAVSAGIVMAHMRQGTN